MVFKTILSLERKEFLDKNQTPCNKANGYYERLIRAVNGYLRLKIPRDRLSLFKPVFLDAIKQHDNQMSELAFKLYTYGLTTRDIQTILSDTFDKKLSPSSISNITKGFEEVRKAWQEKPVESEYYFIYADAIYIATRRDTVQKEAYYVVIGLRQDLKRDILGVYNIPTESSEGWKEVFQNLKKRGLKKTLMIIADGISNLEKVIHEELPGAKLQKCLLHKMKNITKNVRHSDKQEILKDFQNVFQLEDPTYTKESAKKEMSNFINKWKRIYPNIENKLQEKHFDYYSAYLNFPAKIHRMIYTTNWVERLNKAIRKTEHVRNSFPSPDSALNLICAYLIEYEKKVYKYPITSFIPVQDALNKLLEDDPPDT